MNGSVSGSDFPVVSPSLIKTKPVIIEQFDPGIGEEWLPCVGLADETSDEMTDSASDVMEWLSSLPDVGSVMECREGESTSMWNSNIKSNNESSIVSVKPTKRSKLSLSNS